MNGAAKSGRCIPAQNGIAADLVLNVDLEAVMRCLAAPESGRTPARTAVRKESAHEYMHRLQPSAPGGD